MVRSILACVLWGMVVVGPAAAQQGAAAAPPTDAEIRDILKIRIDVEHQSVGIVVGLIDAHERRVIAYGRPDTTGGRALDGRSVFEIGSVSKVFTALLLADAVQRREVTLDQPVSTLLPPTVRLPEQGARKIELVDLATHTSGLPRLPANLSPKDPANPYADYSVDQLYTFLGGVRLSRDIGSAYEYSNLGAGLLGHVLSLRARQSYGRLLRDRITGPLGMTSTDAELTRAERARLVPGHDELLRPAANWDLSTLAGAGAIKSDADGMLTFLAAQMGLKSSPLGPAMASMLATRRPTSVPNLQIALGWHVTRAPGGEIVWHNGGTGGYRSMVAFDPAARVGVVVLSNSAVGVDDIALHLLRPEIPLAHPAAPRRPHAEVVVDPRILAGYVGVYSLSPTVQMTVTLEDGHLFLQPTGQPKYPLHSQSTTSFFLTEVEVVADFTVGPDGKATAVVVRQGGHDYAGARVG